jgi:toxin-antitoxin system PIN domain toxin
LIAVDSNILVYAHRRDSPFYNDARGRIEALAEGSTTWAIPWPCMHEFFGVVTNPRVYRPASTTSAAIGQIDIWRESPSLVLLSATDRHWLTLRNLILESNITGPRIHDARIAALCIQHGVTELWSQDRDFSRFPGLKVVNPLRAA